MVLLVQCEAESYQTKQTVQAFTPLTHSTGSVAIRTPRRITCPLIILPSVKTSEWSVTFAELTTLSGHVKYFYQMFSPEAMEALKARWVSIRKLVVRSFKICGSLSFVLWHCNRWSAVFSSLWHLLRWSLSHCPIFLMNCPKESWPDINSPSFFSWQITSK